MCVGVLGGGGGGGGGELAYLFKYLALSEYGIYIMVIRVKSGNLRHQVNSDIHLQTVEIQMRRLLMSRLIRIFTVCLVNLFFIPIIKKRNKQGCCPNLSARLNLHDLTLREKPIWKELWDVETWHLGSTIPSPAMAMVTNTCTWHSSAKIQD